MKTITTTNATLITAFRDVWRSFATACFVLIMASANSEEGTWPRSIELFPVNFGPATPQVLLAKAYTPLEVGIWLYSPSISRVSVTEPTPSAPIGVVELRFMSRPFDNQMGPPPPDVYRVELPRLAPGTYDVRLYGGFSVAFNDFRRLVVSESTFERVRYQQSIDETNGRFILAPSLAWARERVRTPVLIEDPLFMWSPQASSAPADTVAVHRFSSRTDRAFYFYTSRPAELALLRSLSSFVDEGAAFRAFEPKAGVCPVATSPIYRVFSSELVSHRYTREASVYTFLIEREGWIGEGVAFCLPTR